MLQVDCRAERFRGWPEDQISPPGPSRYDQLCAAIDAATTVATLTAIHDEATGWLLASAGRNLAAAREAAGVRERAARKAAELSRPK